MREREVAIAQVLAGCAFVIFVVAIFLALNRPEFRLRRLFVGGTTEVSQEEVRARIVDNLSGYYWHIVPRDSVFIAPVEKMKASLASEFPRLRDINIARTWGGTYSVRLREYEPAYISCIESKCYFVAADGFRYSRAPEFIESNFVELIGGTTTPRAFILPESQFAQFSSIIEDVPLPLPGDYIKSITFTLDGDYVAQAFLGYELRFDDELSRAQVRDRLMAVYESADFTHKLNENPDRLLYIDLRFGNKVFYKFRDDEVQ